MIATVVVPTHDHGRLLGYAVRSALAQTVSDLEVLVVGDGADDETRATARALEAHDGRVRFFDHPKGPRHGEVHRHAVLAGARGGIVCYLSDDDLWLPDHVEVLATRLEHADLARAAAIQVDPDGRAAVWTPNPADLRVARSGLALREVAPLSCVGHTIDLYRRLPHGWRTTPDDAYTDLHMWRQLLDVAGVRAADVASPTVVNFPSPDRSGHTLVERSEELGRWSARLADPAAREALVDDVQAELRVEMGEGRALFHAVLEEALDLRGRLVATEDYVTRLEARVRGLDRERVAATTAHARTELERQRLDEALAGAERDRAETGARLAEARALVDAMRATTTWRWRQRLVVLPGVRTWIARRRRSS